MSDAGKSTNEKSRSERATEKMNLINEARTVLRGNRDLDRLKLMALCKQLITYDQFAYASEIMLVKMELDQQDGKSFIMDDYHILVKCIYKDHSLPSSFKFKKALDQLNNRDELAYTCCSESCGLAGAIYKRKWQYDHQYKNLVLSRYYYKRGYSLWQEYLKGEKTDKIQNDDGYTAINYAYINELMAVDKLEEYGEITGITDSILEKLSEAKEVRNYILNTFLEDIGAEDPELKEDMNSDWILATVAEAWFGLRNYKQAFKFINRYMALKGKEPWELRTFSQQLFSIAYLQHALQTFADKHKKNEKEKDKKDKRFEKEALDQISGNIDLDGISTCLKTFLSKDDEEEIEKNKTNPEIKKGGKLGLALSGGGFRASLFHIGVLAALAEKDELRNLEVISCVSGGSIIGAYYYIKLKNLLEEKSDNDITREDYINIVRDIEKEFLKGVQKNLRVRIFNNPFSVIKMMVNKNYSRTHRLGELYEKHLYKNIWKGEDGMYMSELCINPEGVKNFDIVMDNWNRKNKIPQLVLNATSVNTGHNWQFTASWMGEPPGNIYSDVDVKPRLRRMYYAEAPKEYQKFRLGYAVGASSCVPVMFQPMPMLGLYPDIDLELIDGGLHDNQGIAALIDQECSNMIVSDASGQLPTSTAVSGNEAAVFYRADNILQERLRELQFMDLKERNNTAQLNTLLTMHLKNDLQQNPINWKFCTDPARTIVYANVSPENKDLTKYGILRTIQTYLSQIRTDLDCFSDIEAYGLMYSGYLQTHYEWNKQNIYALDNQNNIATSEREEDKWNFTAIRKYVENPEKAEDIKNVLQTGSKLLFKIFELNKLVKAISFLLGALILVLLGWLIVSNWQTSLANITVKGLVLFVGIFFIGRISKALGFLADHVSSIKKWMTLLVLTFIGSLICGLYLLILNPLYKQAGKLAKNKE